MVRTVATTGEGVEELMEAVGRCAAEKLTAGPSTPAAPTLRMTHLFQSNG